MERSVLVKLNKKHLAARALGVGIDRISFNKERLGEIKEAITKQDIRDLARNGAIKVREIGAQRTYEKRKQRRREGSVRKKVIDKKRNYMSFIRGARRYIAHTKKQGTLNRDQALLLRKEIRARRVSTKADLRERIKEVQNA